MNYISGLCALITFFMAALHFALLLGAPIGEYVLGGEVKVIPVKKRWLNLILVLLFVFLGILYLGNAGIVGRPLPTMPTKVIMGLYTAFLAYAIIGNTFLTKSKKEKYVMIPASIIGFISSLLTLIFT